MLEAPLGKHRHIEAGNRLYSARYNIALKRVQPFHVVLSKRDERNALRYSDHRWLRIGTEPNEPEVMRRRIRSAIRPAKSSAIGQRVFDLPHTPPFLVQHRIVDN